MKRSLVVLLVVFNLSSLKAQSTTEWSELDQKLNELLRVTQAPGFAIGIVKGNTVIYSKGFGYRDIEHKLPVDANTLFPIGSCTKAFTCAILGQLEKEQLLSFENSPIDYISDLHFYTPALDSLLSITDLMSHRTDIPRHDYSWYLFPSESKDSLLSRIKHHVPFTGIRKKWHYNNFMYLVLGVISERITGKSWEENIGERLFQPLEMTRSNLTCDSLISSSNIAIGYSLRNDSVIHQMNYYRIGGMAPAGSINSCVNDMVKWLKVWLNEGYHKNQAILPPAYVSEAMSSQAVVNGGMPGKDIPGIHFTNYGYGWYLHSYCGHYLVEHGGKIDGFSANVGLFPSDSLGIVVLSNQHLSPLPNLVRNTVADHLLQLSPCDWKENYLASKQKRKASPITNQDTKHNYDTIPLPPRPLPNYTGVFHHPGYGQIYIQLQNDSLLAHAEQTIFYLKHLGNNVFQPTNDKFKSTVPPIHFIQNQADHIKSFEMHLEPALKTPIIFKRLPDSSMHRNPH
jgi:CubicO group peptidase (beta-lactamase class C family)